jgi:antitoxin MazE
VVFACRLQQYGRPQAAIGQIEIQDAAERTFTIAKAPRTGELLARLRKFRGRLPATFKFVRLEANERG